MAKPKTSYSPVIVAIGSILLNNILVQLNSAVYRLSGFTGATPAQNSFKTPASYAAVLKNATSYDVNNSPDSAWFLNSTFLTFTNTIYLLNGYLTGTAPSQLNNKPKTSYQAV